MTINIYGDLGSIGQSSRCCSRTCAPQPRPSTPTGRDDEVANLIVYTCSEQASGISGAALRVDGGVVRFVA